MHPIIINLERFLMIIHLNIVKHLVMIIQFNTMLTVWLMTMMMAFHLNLEYNLMFIMVDLHQNLMFIMVNLHQNLLLIMVNLHQNLKID